MINRSTRMSGPCVSAFQPASKTNSQRKYAPKASNVTHCVLLIEFLFSPLRRNSDRATCTSKVYTCHHLSLATRKLSLVFGISTLDSNPPFAAQRPKVYFSVSTDARGGPAGVRLEKALPASASYSASSQNPIRMPVSVATFRLSATS